MLKWNVFLRAINSENKNTTNNSYSFVVFYFYFCFCSQRCAFVGSEVFFFFFDKSFSLIFLSFFLISGFFIHFIKRSMHKESIKYQKRNKKLYFLQTERILETKSSWRPSLYVLLYMNFFFFFFVMFCRLK